MFFQGTHILNWTLLTTSLVKFCLLLLLSQKDGPQKHYFIDYQISLLVEYGVLDWGRPSHSNVYNRCYDKYFLDECSVKKGKKIIIWKKKTKVAEDLD